MDGIVMNRTVLGVLGTLSKFQWHTKVVKVVPRIKTVICIMKNPT